VLPHPDLAPIYIYIKGLNKLVPGPRGYAGLGPPPPLTDEEMKRAKTVASFSKYESQSYESKDGSTSKGKGKSAEKKGTDGKEAKARGKVKAAAETPSKAQFAVPAKRGKEKNGRNADDAKAIDEPDTQDRVVDSNAQTVVNLAAAATAMTATDIDMVDELEESEADQGLTEPTVTTAIELSFSGVSAPNQPVPTTVAGNSQLPDVIQHSNADSGPSHLRSSGTSADVSSTSALAHAAPQPQAAPPLAAAAPSTTAPAPTTPAITKPAVKVGRKPKYTDAERGFPTYTPSASPAVVLSPSELIAEPIVSGDFDSSVLLPRASKKHPAYVRDTSSSVTPGTPLAQSTSMPRQVETPLAGMMSAKANSKKRKASPRSGSPAITLSTPPPASSTKKARTGESTAAAESTDAPPEVSQDGLEVPLEWLQLREKFRRQQAEEEEAMAAQAAARLKRKEEDEAERAKLEAEKQAEAAAQAEEKAKKEVAREARASQRARTEEEKSQRLAEVKAKKEEEKKRKEEEKAKKAEEKAKKAEERAQKEAQKRAAKAEVEAKMLAAAKEISDAKAATQDETSVVGDANAAVGTSDDANARELDAEDAREAPHADQGSLAPPSPASMRQATPSIARSSPIPTTPLVSTPLSRYLPESTPLLEVTPAPDGRSKSTAAIRYSKGYQPRGGPKIDLGHVRRSNEVLQTLRESGSILEVNQFRREVWDWHKRWAGTDHHHAPRVATQMDRGVFIKCLTLLVEEGRLLTTTATIPTITGQIKQAKVYWLPETKKETVNTYIRSLGQMMTLVYSPKSRATAKIAATEFTEVRLPGQPGLRAKRSSIRPQPPSVTSQKLSAAPSVTVEQRRTILQQDSNAVPILYGYHSGRNARIATMHQGIVQALAERPDAEGVFSTSPRIFGLELLFNDIAASKWFKSISWVRYSEELAAYLADPSNEDEPIRNIPASARPAGGFGGHLTKTKMLSMLDAMAELKLVVPLAITNADDADYETKDKSGTTTWFKRAKSVAEAMFFRAYEAAPVYHIASDAASLLGVLSVQTTEQAETFWKVTRDASTLSDINALPVMERQMDHTRHAPLTNQLDVKNPDLMKNLRTRVRWKGGVRLLDVQRSAIEGLVNLKTGEVRVNAEELEAFAYEWCLPVSVVQEHIDHRVDKASKNTQKKLARQRDQEAAIKLAYARRKAAEEDLRIKIEEMKAANKAEWEKRVRAAAERTGTEYSEELEAFLTRHSLHALQFSYMLPGRGSLTDEAMDEGCKMYIRRKAVGGSAALPGQEKPRAVKKAPLHRRTRKEKKVKVKLPRGEPTSFHY
jgi:actin-related protein